MAAEPARLLGLAEAIAEGRSVDWGDAEASAGSDADRALIQQLRLLAGVAEIHRAGDDDSALEAATPIDPLVGRRWGTLDIRGLIGKGSFGSVYRAWDPRLERDVALKLIRGGSSDGDQLLTEGKLLARVRHPHVVTVYGADRADGRVGIWMELIQGRTLEEGLQQDGPLGAREAALIGIDLCGALASVHGQGLVHRDVKARNVMREEGGRIVLMDFGAGRDRGRTGAGAGAVGTPLYMAPETLRGAEASPSSDIYSLGVLLFRLVTGRFPVEGRTSQEVAGAHESGTRQRMRDLRANLPAWFVAAIERAISPEPRNRFQTAAAFEAALAVGHAPAVTARRRILTAAAIALVGVLAAGLAWSLRQNGFGGRTPALRPIVSTIGVRPLRNLTGDPGQDLFATGLTEVLLSQLGAIRSLRILEVTDPVASRDCTQPAVPGVEAWLEGSVQRSDGQVRISARLLQAGTGAILWGGSYEGTDREAFMLQGRVAAELARELRVSVTETESRRLARRYDVDPQAVNAYLRGKHLLDNFSFATLTRARAELESAVRIDPHYAQAHATLAAAYMDLGNIGALSPTDVRALAPAAADAAVREDPLLADAVLARADVRFRLDWNWAAAEADYQLAMDLNPSDIQARSRYVRFLAASLRVDEGLRLARESLAIDPLSNEMHSAIGFMLYYAGRYQESIDCYLERRGTSTGGHIGLGRSYAAAGMFPEAIAELRAAYQKSDDDPSTLAELGRTLAASGHVDEARRILDALEKMPAGRFPHVSPQDRAYIYVALGDRDTAIRLLDEAVTARESRLLWLGVDPRVRSLRADPRFVSILRRLGIPFSATSKE